MLMQNTNNCIGNYIFSLFVPSKLINEPILDHFILLTRRSDNFDV